MSDDEGISFSSSAGKRRRRGKADTGPTRYAGGGASGARKADNPAGWSRTPDSRSGADRRSKW